MLVNKYNASGLSPIQVSKFVVRTLVLIFKALKSLLQTLKTDLLV
ncbi:hypothetical protein GXM_01351 [Nostoc sphaeroides CCNUC1]|uniref:Uncharacterized protein n=1 Tax=Nostoc sphaeroides CCNUC1 TaxID=2653204 RepID=A0A5P8VTT7_9NOSO|nr:hypothetical protein GXM_01351 [Nostoc sphaeroides CCNUC1]